MGRAWLSNFDDSERAIASRLIDSVTIASSAVMRAKLAQEINRVRAEVEGQSIDLGRAAGPSVLIPVDSVKSLPPLPEGVHLHVAYETFEPGRLISPTPGSEAFIGSLIRDFAGEDPNRIRDGWLHPQSSVAQLYSAQCRALFHVTDYAGTGNQVTDFASTFFRHSRLRSWRSLGWIRLHVITYAASATAYLAASRSRAIDGFHAVTAAQTMFTAGWTDSEREEVELLCVKYGDGRNDALGYRRSRGLYATDTHVPNNLPYILRKAAPGWSPFFDGRRVPTQVVSQIGGYRAEIGISQVLSQLGKDGAASSADRKPARAALLTAVLAMCERGFSADGELASTLGMGSSDVSELLAFIERAGWIDGKRWLTATGAHELKSQNHRTRSRARTRNQANTYYPSQLR